MRKFTTIVAALLLSVATFAQAPQGFSYQAVVRDAQNAIVANQEVDVTLTITAEIDGVVLQTYTEKHSVTTNANGLLTLVVGQGESSQKLSDIKWNLPNAIYNMRTETKYGAATTQLLSVPFAMYAEQAGDIDVNQLAKKLNSSDVQALLGLVRAEDLEEIRKYINDSLAAYGNTYIKKTDVNVLTNNYVTKEVFENYVVSGGNPEAVDLTVYAKNADVEKTYAKKDDVEKTYAKKDEIRNFTTMRDVKDTVGFYYAKKADLDQYAPFRYVADTFNYIRSSYAPKEYVSKNYVTKEAFDNYVLSGGNAESVDLTVYAKTADVENTYAKKSDIPSLSGYALKSDIPAMPTVPTKVSELQNDANYLTSHQDISGKQDVIDDLDDIRSGAALGATALQSHQDITGKANKSEMSITPGANSGTAVIKLQNDMQETVLTAHQSLADYAKTADIAETYATKAEIPAEIDLSSYYSKAQVEALLDDFKNKLFAGKLSQNDEVGGAHEYVDLGLPSGTLWATCNVGASQPQEFGSYYAWGTTEEYDDNIHWVVSETPTMPAENDAASVLWGGNWLTPTLDQWQELNNNCYFEWVTSYNDIDVKGQIAYKAKDESDKGKTGSPVAEYSLSDTHIFLPAGGYKDENAEISNPNWGVYSVNYVKNNKYSSIVILQSGRNFFTGRSLSDQGLSVRPVWSTSTSAPASVADLDNYYTKSQGDDRYVLKTNAYNKTESDDRYVQKEKVYTKSEVDSIVAVKLGFFAMDGEIEGKFSVTSDKQIVFSRGNLVYNYNNSEWRFAEQQYYVVNKIKGTYSEGGLYDYKRYSSFGDIDVFYWGTSGWSGTGAPKYNMPYVSWEENSTVHNILEGEAASTKPKYSDFYLGSSASNSAIGSYAEADWGVHNAIKNGENKAGVWRLPTEAEWEYLFNGRPDAANKHCMVSIVITESTGGKYFEPSTGLPGLLLMPDNWDAAVVAADAEESGRTLIKTMVENIGKNTVSTLGSAQLQYLEKKYGVVFLPNYYGRGMMGDGHESNDNYPQSQFKLYSNSNYWTSTSFGLNIYVINPESTQNSYDYTSPREYPCSVRLVRDIDF